MKIKRSFALTLCLCMLAGCGAPAAPTETTQTPTDLPEPTEETEVTEVTEPDDGSFRMYYDDRLPVEALTGGPVSEVTFENAVVTSRVVGSQTPDEAVLTYADGILQAVGAGTVTVVADGAAYPVTVRPAPISLVMITGHSLGAGQYGNPLQSVLCPAGQVYSTVLADSITYPTPDTGLGAGAPNRPAGIDALTTANAGRIGEAGGLAYRWNQLTGEKIWVLNAAVGGSCINEWVPGADYYGNAVSMLMKARSVLTNEIAAGHYKLKNTAVVYHSAANFAYKEVSYNQQTLQMWYDSMWAGYAEACSGDITGDGIPDGVQCLGFVPLMSGAKYETDKPATFYMSASRDFPAHFTASTAQLKWTENTATFPAPDYPTCGEPVERPLMRPQLYAADGVHLTQVAYNALGMDIAENLYRYLREKAPATTVTLADAYGTTVTGSRSLRKGNSLLLTPLTDPGTRGKLTFTVTDNLQLTYPLEITAVGEGTGTLTVKSGNDILLTLEIPIQ